MGVPKFFRYISERYPCLSELVRENQVPEIDNLYLDMNGIIHNCSHPNDSDVHFRITEDQIFQDIFHYLDSLFNMIKPQRLFFLAVDGVAPRAKMNQQRGRRFRSAKEAETQEKNAIANGEELPSEARFDSNCITPGTPFMVRLNDAMKYFIQMKVTQSPEWRKCQIILSGHETPGEGEHKIMEYIRFMKAQKGFDPNTRHCLYGLDADLIMLGLCTHERHFSLLREEVKFGKSAKRAPTVDATRFFLLHLSLMREYLELEFAALKGLLKFEFDVEKIIDDWVLMGYLVGNDFIPNIPNLHINTNALPILYQAYINTMPNLDGYINEGGKLNLPRLESYLETLGQFDKEFFNERYDDLKFLETKHNQGYNNRNADTFGGELDAPPSDPDLLELANSTAMFAFSADDEADECESVLPFSGSPDGNDEEIFEKEFKQYKRNYYVSKLGYSDMTPDVLMEQAECYIRALQWTLSYYYHGVQSWGWYYPHHYAPFISDLKNFKDLNIDFDMGHPFLPFEQLLSVLPAASGVLLLPEPYKKLMTSPESEIIEYYPSDFETDLNGKKQEWEAVVLIPFIDEKKLLKAMKIVEKELSPEDKARNIHGPMYSYKYNEESTGSLVAPHPRFQDLGSVFCREQKLNREDVQISPNKLVLGPSKGAYMDYYFPGFPTMKHLKYSCDIRKCSVKVFDQPSRSESMVVKVETDPQLMDTKSLAEAMIHNSVFVSWPHLYEAFVVRISDKNNTYYPNGRVEKTESNQFNLEVNSIKTHHMSRMAIDVGEVNQLIYVKPNIGHEYVFTNKMYKLQKTWSNIEVAYPAQCVVRDIKAYMKKFQKHLQVSQVYNKNTTVFMLNNPYYGSIGEVIDNSFFEKNGRIKVLLTVPREPNLQRAIDLHRKMQANYMNSYQTATFVNLSANTFNRITGSVLIISGQKRHISDGTPKSNIGLQVKFPKNNEELVGYTKKQNNMWLYSDKVVDLVKNYYNKVPQLFSLLEKTTGNDLYFESDIFSTTTDAENNLKSLLSWVNNLPHNKAERRAVGSQVAEKEVIEEVSLAVDQIKSAPLRSVTLQIKPHLLYMAELHKSSKMPDPKSNTHMFDRVVVAKNSDKFPVGTKGTVIAIHEIKDSNPVRKDCINKVDLYCDILFDQELADAQGAHGVFKNRVGKIAVNTLINITFGQEEETPNDEQLTQNSQTKTDNEARVEKKEFLKSSKPTIIPEPQPMMDITKKLAEIAYQVEASKVLTTPTPKSNTFQDFWDVLKSNTGVNSGANDVQSKEQSLKDILKIPTILQPSESSSTMKSAFGIKNDSLEKMLGMTNDVQNLNICGSNVDAQNQNDISSPPTVLPAPPVKWMINESNLQNNSSCKPSLPFFNNSQQMPRHQTHYQNGNGYNRQQPVFNTAFFGNNNNDHYRQDTNRSFFPNNGNYSHQYHHHQKQNYGPHIQLNHQQMHKNMHGSASSFIPLQAAIKSTKNRHPELTQQKPQKIVVPKQGPQTSNYQVNDSTITDSIGGQESHFSSSRHSYGQQSRNSGSSRKSRLAARFPTTD